MKNPEEIRQFCEQNKICMVDFKMVDLDGRWRHITIPVDRFTDDTLCYGIGFDGSNYGYAPVEKSDMVFIPDPDTAVIDPFAGIPTLSMSGSVRVIGESSHSAFDQYPVNVAQAAVRYMKRTGIADKMMTGPEFEFYLFDQVSYETAQNRASWHVDTREAAWNTGVEGGPNSGYQVKPQGGYHISAPQDLSFDLRSKICMLMEDWGIRVKYHHHEAGGPGQLEIEVELGEMVKMADDTMITKYIVKNAAAAQGRTATFMPKPIYGEAGSGMHVHMLLTKDGEPVFYDRDGYSGLSRTALWFIGGLLKHASSLCAFTNPSTNSYKRLVPGYEAPVTVGYATSNRSAVIRIPAYAKAPMQKRFELRSPDATANPYYAYAAILMAGLDGVENRIDPHKNGWGPYDCNLYTLSQEEKARIRSLPKSLDEALDALTADHDYLTKDGVFPERLIQVWVNRKREEGRKISEVPHPAEFSAYYDL